MLNVVPMPVQATVLIHRPLALLRAHGPLLLLDLRALGQRTKPHHQLGLSRETVFVLFVKMKKRTWLLLIAGAYYIAVVGSVAN
jgi:hypothetical protein